MAIGIQVKKIMTRPVVKIEYNKSVQTASKIMTKHRVGSIIIVKKNKPIGIITETDLNKKVVARALNPQKLKVKDVMSSPLVFISPSDDVITAVEKMKKHRIKRMPVVEGGEIVGIITDTDIARASPELLDVLNHRLEMRYYQPTIKETSTSGLCEICGEYSESLTIEDDQWVCENCREQ
jgi:signal-transduction protein with cAMP-binding, CBS, and nucleotidyltransferase domain